MAPEPAESSVSVLALPLGTSVCFAAVVRGDVRIVQGFVVAPGALQSVVACPGACNLSESGDWCCSDEKPVVPTFECESEEPGTSVPVTFYSIRSSQLYREELPGDVLRFERKPVIDALSACFREAAGGDALLLNTVLTVDAAAGSTFEVNFGKTHRPFVWNSVLVIRSTCKLPTHPKPSVSYYSLIPEADNHIVTFWFGRLFDELFL
eukprot:TRINITY_DN33792_c0_g1_i5.p1 TRINITY_DN33792_c0_g1~~TRINITY_DN33792_c0_g1_i5.p1  ORF type:complete len:208 (+),score=21.98 TRINITY_DN33792_c0_g1_i5:179-802(+)